MNASDHIECAARDRRTRCASKAISRWALAVALLTASSAAMAQAAVGGPDTRRNYELPGTAAAHLSDAALERAVRQALEQVDNQIQIDRSHPRTDDEIVADVRRMLQWDANVDSRTIGVSAADGVVTLTGTVSDGAEKRRAVGLSWVAGGET